MRLKLLLIEVFIFVMMYQLWAGEIVLVSEGASKYIVTVNSGSSFENEQKAANLFRQYVKQATGINLPITVSKDFRYRIDFKEDSTFEDETFQIRNIEDKLLVTGGRSQGLLNAVTYILYQYFDVEFLSAGNVSVSVIKNVSIKTPLSINQKPSFKKRMFHGIEGYDQDYIETHFLQIPFFSQTAFPNNFTIDFLPPEHYYRSHSEYYSLRSARRDTIQPNLLNPEVLEIVKQKVLATINKNFSGKPVYYNLFLNDNPFVSEDVQMQTKDNRFVKNYSDLYLNFVNNIANSFPLYSFLALAYEQTKNLPAETMPLKNVNVILTNADNNKSKPMQQDDYDVQQHLHMKTLLPQWLKKDPDLLFWDYIANYTNSLMPWPNLYTIKPDLKYYKSLGVKNVFLQGAGLFPSENSELKAFLCSSLMWNTDYNDDSLILDFCKKFYRTSGMVMYNYISEINRLAFTGNEAMYTYDNAEKFSKTLFSFKNINKWQKLLLKAENDVHNTTIAKRIMKERLGLDCVYIELSVQVPGWNTIDNKTVLNNKIDKFLNETDYVKLTRISDGVQDINMFILKLKKQNK